MSQKLISHSPDLARLRSDGYDVAIVASYLVVRHVPYVTNERKVKLGTLVTKLNLAGDVTARPDNHQVHFAGEYPCHHDGSQMTELVSSACETRIGKELTTAYSFSQKPKVGHYIDYYEKMSTYAAILTAQAHVLDTSATPRTYRVDEPEHDESPFNYLDTASSRADVNVIAQKLSLDSLAIIGLGGTGSYILDQIAKTTVRSIHIFDGDKMSTHNAFRSPGAPSVEELRTQPLKVDYYKERYSKMHRGIVTHAYHVDESNIDELRTMKFVFLSIDAAEAKRVIVGKLEEFGISFIDVGMGIYAKNEMLGGIARVTTSTPRKRAHVHERGRIAFGKGDGAEIYDQNIQISDLNALNAVLAVIKWKKLFGFYADSDNEHFTTYTIDCNLLTSEDTL